MNLFQSFGKKPNIFDIPFEEENEGDQNILKTQSSFKFPLHIQPIKGHIQRVRLRLNMLFELQDHHPVIQIISKKESFEENFYDTAIKDMPKGFNGSDFQKKQVTLVSRERPWIIEKNKETPYIPPENYGGNEEDPWSHGEVNVFEKKFHTQDCNLSFITSKEQHPLWAYGGLGKQGLSCDQITQIFATGQVIGPQKFTLKLYPHHHLAKKGMMYEKDPFISSLGDDLKGGASSIKVFDKSFEEYISLKSYDWVMGPHGQVDVFYG